MLTLYFVLLYQVVWTRGIERSAGGGQYVINSRVMRENKKRRQRMYADRSTSTETIRKRGTKFSFQFGRKRRLTTPFTHTLIQTVRRPSFVAFLYNTPAHFDRFCSAGFRLPGL